ncbi:MAG: hypothetical protein O3C17_26750, partial [Planctomycetota bacterium]|nr:hypothetical protein [Planctomycetota bacterium]
VGFPKRHATRRVSSKPVAPAPSSKSNPPHSPLNPKLREEADRPGIAETGLSVKVRILEKLYETGRKASDTFKANMPIEFDDLLPRYNYRVAPQLHD